MLRPVPIIACNYRYQRKARSEIAVVIDFRMSEKKVGEGRNCELSPSSSPDILSEDFEFSGGRESEERKRENATNVHSQKHVTGSLMARLTAH